MRALHDLVAPPAGSGVRVDGAALQRGQRELGRDEYGGAGGEHHERQQRKQSEDHAQGVLTETAPGRLPGRLGEGSASDGSWDGRWAAKPGSDPAASTGACGT